MEQTKTMLVILFTICFFMISLSSARVVDFCVADFTYPVGPSGYPCKNPANLTADDFVSSILSTPTPDNTTAAFNLVVTQAIDLTFPALNGLDLSMLRLDIGVGGVVPLHTHRASELIIVIEGKIIAGFIASDDIHDTPFYKTLNKGDIMIFPQGLLHFQVNVGKVPALAFVSLNSASPGFQTTSFALGASDLPTDIIHKITLLDSQQVKKLKAVFGGTN